MSARPPDPLDDDLGRRLARELPRFAAPERLRGAVLAGTARPRRGGWLAPTVAACATALVAALAVVQWLPRPAPADATQQLVRAVVSEHSRALMWGSRRQDVMPAALPQLAEASGIGLARVFAGDDRLTFVAAEPVYLDRVRGVALHYRDVDGHLLSYIVLPARRLAVPDRERVQVGRFRPALLRDPDGFVSWVWKQGDLACFIVSDMVSREDLERFKDYFVRLRLGTEPFAY